MTPKQQAAFLARYTERYKWFENIVIEHTSMEMLGITDEQDISDWKDFFKKLLWRKYSAKITRRWWQQLCGEKMMYDLYNNYWPKWMSEIEYE